MRRSNTEEKQPNDYKIIFERLYKNAKGKNIKELEKEFAYMVINGITLDSFPPQYNLIAKLYQEGDTQTIDFLTREFAIPLADIQRWIEEYRQYEKSIDEKSLDEKSLDETSLDETSYENVSPYENASYSRFQEIQGKIMTDENYSKLMDFNTTQQKQESIQEFASAIASCRNLDELSIYLSPTYRKTCQKQDKRSLALITQANKLQTDIYARRGMFASNAETYLKNLYEKFSEYVKNLDTPSIEEKKPKSK